jgi:ribosomal protein S8
MELIGKITKETADIEKILINFLSFLNENGYINDYDFVYETQIKKFIKQIKTNI